jgi:type I restriction enzyme R subunit
MFNESNTVEAYVYATCSPAHQGCLPANQPPRNRKPATAPAPKASAGATPAPAEVPRQIQEVLVEPWLREALIRLNPEIAAQPDRADEVLYKLRAIVLSVRSDGLIRANEEMTAWMRGERSMPFGQNNEHVPVRLIDFDDLAQNQYVVTQQFTYRAGPSAERRADLVLLVNGLPLVLIEAKTPVTRACGQLGRWRGAGARRLREVRAGAVRLQRVLGGHRGQGIPLRLASACRSRIGGRGIWMAMATMAAPPAESLKLSAESMLRPHVVLDILGSFTLFATDKKKRRIKIICRYQQYEAANKIVERVLAGYPKKGLIWHFQGSGKSLLMVFAAQKLRMHPA